jgi:hypothetical protein
MRIKQERAKEEEIMRRSLTEDEVVDCFEKLRHMVQSGAEYQAWQERKTQEKRHQLLQISAVRNGERQGNNSLGSRFREFPAHLNNLSSGKDRKAPIIID